MHGTVENTDCSDAAYERGKDCFEGEEEEGRKEEEEGGAIDDTLPLPLAAFDDITNCCLLMTKSVH